MASSYYDFTSFPKSIYRLLLLLAFIWNHLYIEEIHTILMAR